MLNTFVNPLNMEPCTNGDQNTEKIHKQNFYENSCLNIFLNDILQVYVFNVKVQYTLIIVLSKIQKSFQMNIWISFLIIWYSSNLFLNKNKALDCYIFQLINLMNIKIPEPSLAHSGLSKNWAWSQFSILLCYIL